MICTDGGSIEELVKEGLYKVKGIKGQRKSGSE